MTNQPGYIEAPLESLLEKEMTQMSDEELRQEILKLQKKCLSSQSFQAHVRASVSKIKIEKEPKKDAFSEF